jgi:uncharacterized protein YoxC
MTVINIFLILLIISASALCIFAIVYLKRIFEQIVVVKNDIHQIVQTTLPVLENLEDVTRRANKIVTEAENYWDEIDRSIKNLRERVTNLKSLSKLRDAQNQATDLIKNFKAFAKGFNAFWQEYKHR